MDDKVRRSFEIRDGDAVLAYGDANGIHYAEGQDTESVLLCVHAQMMKGLDSVPEDVEKAYGLYIQMRSPLLGPEDIVAGRPSTVVGAGLLAGN